MTLGVVVPVFHGAAVLNRSLGSLARQSVTADLRVVVVVNDDLPETLSAAHEGADRLLAAGGHCRVVRSPAGRAHALNAAEPHLPRAPRLVLDQDASLSPLAAETVRRALQPGTGKHFAALSLTRPDTTARSVDWYYDVWQALPYVRLSPVTCGAYALSAEGRGRWASFPDLHSDDKFARLHFAPEERVRLEETYDILLPDGFAELVRARRRYRLGNRELARHLQGRDHPDLRRGSGVLQEWLRHPRRWPALSVFLSAHVLAALPGAQCSR